ncbi:endoplasmic reticulum membrane-associated RNA degradation protein isoform X1 [Camarhynchus parvulus]|uniref:endoplasmic reticulum membrane-associated RNA degradation protein isoform X1 n=2 Tax=Geospiza parvula TaxID=87175 RepID=UPI001237FCC8|nr:endoplasmic reticulum membrane-associated RNA degradation protein isoform X1 [Camarhynchus parvulus]
MSYEPCRFLNFFFFKYQMALPDSITTCLSQPVHYVICKLGFEKKDTYNIDTILSGNREVCWPAVTEHVCYLESDQSVDYIKSIRSLGPVCESVNLYFKSLTKEQFVIQYASWFHWTNCTEVFLEVFDVLQSTQATEVALGLMKLTSCLERALGDVYLLKGDDCPFLLRDLLASEQLADVFGQAVMNVLRVFIGSPHGLNLRNVLWHGFASPQEIPAKYCAMLLFLTAGLGQLLQTYLLQTKGVLVHRPYVIFISLEELDAFPDLNSEILAIAEELVKHSSFVLKIMLPFWIAALTAFKQSRYADSVILLLPQLEAGLRLLFTTTNKCPNRLLTAESSALYTTFDEMLKKHLDNEEVNQLPVVLEEPAMDFLWDFLNHQEGPRIRDRLSHGEINLETFPREIANQIVGFAITFLCRFSDEDMFSLKVLECMKSIHLWPELATVPEEQEQKIKGLEGNTEANTLILMISEILSQLQRYMPQDCCSSDDPINSILTERLLVELCGTRVCTLYSPRPVLEVVVILRKISAQCHQVSQQVIAGAGLRHTQWLNKTLRSRQRHNYRRMLSSIKFLSPVLRLILLLITLELVSVHSVCKKNPFDYQQYLKFLKSVLQYTENLVTYTSPDKNKWDETMELTKKTLINIKKITDRKLMLMHLAT